MSADAIDESNDQHRLYTADTPPEVDLLIRTGGEQRISNFLLWQAAYAELYFTDQLWPDFDPAAFDAALTEYARRTRRFGAKVAHAAALISRRQVPIAAVGVPARAAMAGPRLPVTRGGRYCWSPRAEAVAKSAAQAAVLGQSRERRLVSACR